MAVTKRLRYEVLRRDNYSCRYCGRSAPEVKLTVDHVVPVALGGSDEPSNLVAACADAPLVDDVASDALRWSRAIALAAEHAAEQRKESEELYARFEKHWNNWTYQYKGERCTIDKPASWRQTVAQFLDAGLDITQLCELIDVAMESNAKDDWRYFCGCCWSRVRELQASARALLMAGAVNG
ncbi:HNH endonuclease, putative [Mycobacteroides abscessus subsp. massiliense]|uniref:HNH endonuclease n=1 Tax=Mycobacteroides abscessus TaxID=36809 RepID=UPI0009A84DEA|nr:HNH endonuclease [Mycobacteroides abscessus]SLC65388.1 HNH endonuclease, putative [Mycobacteroides abscessus subsp. massiliense]SLI14293.1 HNH endonuclease, putative [Mycobacteroides abscessus subsp. massiliense]